MSAATTNTTTSDGQPTYYYAPPGSSMREPLYFSTSVRLLAPPGRVKPCTPERRPTLGISAVRPRKTQTQWILNCSHCFRPGQITALIWVLPSTPGPQDPVYYVDPKPDTLNAAPLHRQPNTNAEEKAALRKCGCTRACPVVLSKLQVPKGRVVSTLHVVCSWP